MIFSCGAIQSLFLLFSYKRQRGVGLYKDILHVDTEQSMTTNNMENMHREGGSPENSHNVSTKTNKKWLLYKYNELFKHL